MRLLRWLGAVALTAAFLPLSADAQTTRRTCSILDGRSCMPNRCTGLDPGCLVHAQLSISEGLRLTLGTRAAADAKKPEGKLNTLRDLFAALRACWEPPPPENAHRGMQMSMRFSLSRNGRFIGPPRVTYATREVSQRTRDLYRDAMAQSLEGCMPLPLTKEFAGAIAGRPIVVRIIDDREASERPPV
ncbi:hypothetical protein [Bradyrhizobium sp. LHD-71]|uniref:hypothetical protein n=1 Tax=Bradyrhizobium sp. LHD-71 TaxID=3072141 RepID=UPI00280CCD86|nr:hypothetical protein [Bradyrhizobium sp. LHD-71]MDQ8729851.1 hypothetical protein [Bradyrhizobium sp. LHD-71]